MSENENRKDLSAIHTLSVERNLFDLENRHITVSQPQITSEGEEYKNLNSRLHWHDYYELEIILSGSATHIFNDIVYPLGRGDAHISVHSDVHTIYFKKGDKANIYTLNFDEYYLDKKLKEYLQNLPEGLVCKFNEAQLQKMLRYLNGLESEMAGEDEFSEMMRRVQLSHCLTYFFRHAELSLSGRKNGNRNILVRQATSMLYREPSADFGLKEIADKLNVTPDYLGRLFKREYGCSFSEYKKQRKLTIIENLLRATDMPLKQICDEMKFGSPSYLIKRFKEKYGMTPNEFRESVK